MEKTRPARARGLLLAAALLAGLLLCEGALRVLSHVDADGNVELAGRAVRPRRLPVRAVEARVAEYLSMPSPRPVYDPDLGWTYRPGYVSVEGLYRYDADAARVGTDPSPREAGQQTGCIALFGDSFTHGDEVPFEATWGAQAERLLRRRDEGAVVRNFGVGGYGIDQAFLRWKKLGRALAPRTVVLGFQPENVFRGVNVIRPLYWGRTDLPFSKPRFVVERGELRLINVPALPPERLGAAVASLPASDLRPYERYYDASDYEDHPWLASRLVALGLLAASGGRGHVEATHFDPRSEAFEVTMTVLDAFQADAKAAGAAFLVVHLPRRSDLATLQSGRPLPYAELLRRMQERFAVVDPREALLRAATGASLDDLFAGAGIHYSARANRAVGEALARRLAP